jgi:glutamyl-tRNA synthetase
MGITHIIRGDDHLVNAARQTQLYRALDWPVPEFAHIPLIHGPDGAKLSKRHGAEATDAYRAMGYLPEAMRNYLVRLGWSHGDDEIMATEQLIEWFNLEAIGRSPARFDFAKLGDLNGHYIRKTGDEALIGRIRDYLEVIEGGAQKLARLDRDGGWDQLRIALPGLKERAKTLVELVEGAAFLFADRPLALDEKAAKLIDGDARAVLAGLIPRFEAAGAWTATDLEAEVRSFAEATGAKLGKVAQPLRAALTGRSVSPPVFDVMHALGRAETVARLKDQAH